MTLLTDLTIAGIDGLTIAELSELALTGALGVPVAAFSLQDAVGSSTAANFISPGSPGTISGGVSLRQIGPTGNYPYCMKFDGSSGRITFTKPTALVNSPTYSYSLMVRSTNTTTFKYLMDAATGRPVLAWNYDTSGEMEFYNGTEPAWYSLGDAPDDGQWHHLILSVADTTLRFFVDGLEQASLTLTDSASAGGASNMYIASSSAGNFFEGYICAVKLFDVALDADDALVELEEIAIAHKKKKKKSLSLGV